MSLEEYSNNKIKTLYSGTDTTTNDSWRYVTLSDSYYNYDLIIVGLGVSYTEMATVTLPGVQHIPNNKYYDVCWRCQALESGYYSGGQIGLSSSNENKIGWRMRYVNGWSNSSLFFVIGAKF